MVYNKDVYQREYRLKHKESYPISIASNDYKNTGIKKIYRIDDVQPLCIECNIQKRNKIEGVV